MMSVTLEVNGILSWLFNLIRIEREHTVSYLFNLPRTVSWTERAVHKYEGRVSETDESSTAPTMLADSHAIC